MPSPTKPKKVIPPAPPVDTTGITATVDMPGAVALDAPAIASLPETPEGVVEFTAEVQDGGDSAAPAPVECAVAAPDKDAARKAAATRAAATRAAARKLEAYAKRRAASYIPEEALTGVTIPGLGSKTLATLLDEILDDGETYGESIGTVDVSVAVAEHLGNHTSKALWREQLLRKFVGSPRIRAAVAFVLGTSSVGSARVTDAIVRLWFRRRASLRLRLSKEWVSGAGNEAARRRRTGDFLVKRGANYVTPTVVGDRTAPTFPGITRTVTVISKRTDEMVDLRQWHGVRRRDTFFGIIEDGYNRNAVECIALNPAYSNGNWNPAELAWLLHRTPLGLRSCLGSVALERGVEDDELLLATPTPIIPNMKLTRIERTPVLMPMAVAMLWTMSGVYRDSDAADIFMEAAAKCMPSSHRHLLSALEPAPTAQATPEGRVSSRVPEAVGIPLPSPLFAVLNPDELLTAYNANADDYEGPTTGTRGYDFSGTVMSCYGESKGSAACTPPCAWKVAELPFRKYAELFGLPPGDASTSEYVNRVLAGFRSVGTLTCVELDPSAHPNAAFHVFNYEESRDSGVWAIQSSTSTLPILQIRYNLQWAAQSCMRGGADSLKATNYYGRHTVCRLVLALDGTGKICGRAVLWPVVKSLDKTQGKWVDAAPFLDRLYIATPRAAAAFDSYCEREGYRHRSDSRMYTGSSVTPDSDGALDIMAPQLGWFSLPESSTLRRAYADTMGYNLTMPGYGVCPAGVVASRPVDGFGNIPFANSPGRPHAIAVTGNCRSIINAAPTVPGETFDWGSGGAAFKQMRPTATAMRLVWWWDADAGRFVSRKFGSSGALEAAAELAFGGGARYFQMPSTTEFFIGPSDRFYTKTSNGGSMCCGFPLGPFGAPEDDPWNPFAIRIDGKVSVRFDVSYLSSGEETRATAAGPDDYSRTKRLLNRLRKLALGEPVGPADEQAPVPVVEKVTVEGPLARPAMQQVLAA